ncbi:VWFA-related Acidobacterial domain protein [Luteitalea pratensis]|uniref:VWFA-related Acidobacterial domain protein n=1 Tax=Luteitalea pratensis TaxID=1855912 RepID=A0A143PFL6_LUTPR|nr:VWA domain-containing protein [Luteitalea pratensis]AMY07337.1 VWFA-related Acidobacterial domain protein [Luteitalea pratensis]
MNTSAISRFRIALPVLIASLAVGSLAAQQDGFRFRSTTELINVTATVTDGTGRFASRLRKEDFLVREDGQRQQISHFSSERVPVSLGIVLDVSGSMAGEKFRAAQSALDRFLYDLLQPEDEVFILGFSDRSDMVSDWTTDRQQLANALRRLRPRGGTALYDAVAEAVPVAQTGRHKKKAVVVISDGNDTDSSTEAEALQSLIRETEVLVYAIGIDGSGSTGNYGGSGPGTWSGQPRVRLPFPFPVPGSRGGGGWNQPQPRQPGRHAGANDAVNVNVLRAITDDSGGRTEVIRYANDLEPATASIADELSQQYSIGYVPPRSKDGRWHQIEVEVPGGQYHVRARRGYLAQ